MKPSLTNEMVNVSDTGKVFMISVTAAIIAKLVDRMIDFWTKENPEEEVTYVGRRMQCR